MAIDITAPPAGNAAGGVPGSEAPGALAPPAVAPVPAIPQKFQAADGTLDGNKVLTSYLALEQQQSAGPGVPPAAAPPVEPGATPQIEAAPALGDASTIDAFVQSVGLDSSEISERFALKGALTPSQYEAFEKKGHIPRVMVDDYMRNVFENFQAKATAETTKAHALVGGADRMTNLMAWAGQNLTPAERGDLQTRLNNPATLVSAVSEVFGRQQLATSGAGAQPLVEGGSGVGSGGAQGFRTQLEQQTAYNDPRYRVDTVYRAKVDARMAATNALALVD